MTIRSKKWLADRNFFNHYAYGAVADWVYCKAAGIQTVEEFPGYEKVRIAPIPNERLDMLEASVKTRHGLVYSKWAKCGEQWKYEIETPAEAEVVIGGTAKKVGAGRYTFCS